MRQRVRMRSKNQCTTTCCKELRAQVCCLIDLQPSSVMLREAGSSLQGTEARCNFDVAAVTLCPQVQSAAMSTKLRNRRVAEDKLGTFLEQALVSEDLIHQVMDAPVSGQLQCYQIWLRGTVLQRDLITLTMSAAAGAGAGAVSAKLEGPPLQHVSCACASPQCAKAAWQSP